MIVRSKKKKYILKAVDKYHTGKDVNMIENLTQVVWCDVQTKWTELSIIYIYCHSEDQCLRNDKTQGH